MFYDCGDGRTGMSAQRRTLGIYASPAPRGANGERLCRNCRAPLAKGQRHNCSPACSDEWMCKTSPSHARLRVWERDRGICSICGQSAVAGKLRNGIPRTNKAHGTGDLWQVDHIKPVIEGGGECGLDNLRTACTACHKRETAVLAARRAEMRKAIITSPPAIAGQAPPPHRSEDSPSHVPSPHLLQRTSL